MRKRAFAPIPRGDPGVDGEYDGIDYSYPLAQRLTDDLRAICHDKHL